MAYSNAPTQDTYRSERVQLFREMAIRDGSTAGKDEDYLNVFIEPVRQTKAGDDRKFIMKRAGTSNVVASVGASQVRGMYFWSDQYKLFYCVGRNIYVYNVNTGVSTTLTNVFATSTGVVGFCDYLYTNGTVVVCATDGTAINGLVTIDNANTVVTCTDVDLPTHLPYPVFLDGYLFLAKANSADIYNSDLNNPLSWTTTGITTAEMEADLVLRIAKLNNYLVVFGRDTIEYYWDAAAAAPGSPLQRNDTPIKINSYLTGFSVYGNAIYYIGADAGGQPSVYRLKDFKIEEIGTPSISRYLNKTTDGFAHWTGNIISSDGHTYYVITAGSQKTFVTDVDSGLWFRWAYQNSATFDIQYSMAITTSTNTYSYFCFAGTDSGIYKFNKDLYQDNGVNFPCVIVTENNDFGTINRKTMKRLSFIGDRPANDATILVQWSDDDYRTYNTGLTTNMNQDNACVYRMGSFRQRIFKLTFTANELFRIQEVEVDINKGNS